MYGYEYYAQVEKYEIDTNEWTTAPNLNQERANHSSCALGGSIYVFCGSTTSANLGKKQQS